METATKSSAATSRARSIPSSRPTGSASSPRSRRAWPRADARIYEVPISYSGRTYAEGKKIGWKDGVAAFWHITKFNLFVMSIRQILCPAWPSCSSHSRRPRSASSTIIRTTTGTSSSINPFGALALIGVVRVRPIRIGLKAWTGDGYRPLTILAFSVEWGIAQLGRRCVPRSEHSPVRRGVACWSIAWRRCCLPRPWRSSSPRCSPSTRFTSRPSPTSWGSPSSSSRWPFFGRRFSISRTVERALRPRTAWLVALLYAIALLLQGARNRAPGHARRGGIHGHRGRAPRK